MITDGPQIVSKTEVEIFTRHNKISPSNSIQGLLDNREERLLSMENDKELVRSSSYLDLATKLALEKVKDLNRESFVQSEVNIFESGTPKEFLKNVSFSIHLSGNPSPLTAP